MLGEVAGVPGIEERQQLADLGEPVLGFLQLIKAELQPQAPLCPVQPAPAVEVAADHDAGEEILDPVVEPRVIP